MNLETSFVPPELFQEYFPSTNQDTPAGATGMCSTVITLTVVYFCHPAVNTQATTVWQAPSIGDMSTLHAL